MVRRVGLLPGELARHAGRLERHAQFAGERLEHRAGAVVHAAGCADREHALRVAAAERDPERVSAGVALDDHAVAVGDRDRAAGVVAGELRHGGQAGGDDGVAVGGRDERAARLPQRALAGERPVVPAGGAAEGMEDHAAQAEEGELDQGERGAAREEQHRGGTGQRGEEADGVRPALGAGQVRGDLGHGGSGPSPRVVGEPALSLTQRALPRAIPGPPRRLTGAAPVARMPAVRWWDSRAVKGDGL